MERLSVDVYTTKARTDCFAYDSNSGKCTALREIQCKSGRCKFYKTSKNTGGTMSVDFEKVLKEKLSEEAFSIISSSENEFGDWLDRCVEAHKLAIKALEEIQQYREIGTVEEFRKCSGKKLKSLRKHIEETIGEVPMKNLSTEALLSIVYSKNMTGLGPSMLSVLADYVEYIEEFLSTPAQGEGLEEINYKEEDDNVTTVRKSK